jgi:hypothetical protein
MGVYTMIRACLINSSNVCINVVSLNTLEEFVPYDDIVLAPDHTGSIGWIWQTDRWFDPNAPVITEEYINQLARRKRNNLLKQTVDRINPLRWESYSQEQKDAWTEYRQALLDVPQQEGFPLNITWPVKPE